MSTKKLKQAMLAARLQPKHIKWIITAAREHFQDRVQRLELEIMQHEHFAGEPNRTPYWHLQRCGVDSADGNRTEIVREAREDLEEQRRITTFLKALEDLWVDVSFAWDADDIAKLINKRWVP